jgi:predicted GNAT family N-acyltransferase
VSVTARPAADAELAAVYELRHRVFCVEQGVPEDLERDEDDGAALHLVAVDEDAVIGTCRLVRGEESWRLGRMAVLEGRRGDGVGGRLLDSAHAEALRAGARRMVLASQVPARGFYERRGYIAQGEEFMDAGIPHVLMTLDLSTED